MQELVYLENGHPVTDSLMLAEIFGKEHKRVMQDIRELECSEEFREHHFVLSSYKSAQNKDLPKYTITRDGFTILAMGYTGKKAMQFKERYIQEFNRMSKELQEMKDGVQMLNQEKVLELPIQAEQPEVIPRYDLNQPWAFKPNPVYVSAVLDFPTKDVLLQAVGYIGAIEREQMIDLFGVGQKHIHSMLCKGELLPHELWLNGRKQIVYTLGLRGSEWMGIKSERLEYWSIAELLEKLIFFEFVKHLQAKEPRVSFEIKAEKTPFVGRISLADDEYKVIVLQRPISRFVMPEDDGTAIFILTSNDEYIKPFKQQFEQGVHYNYTSFMPVIPIEKSTDTDPFDFLNELP
ncbi:Rha family transcriptional regulator [Paenibacillus sonchi]|uniref:Rha family transcriptional regulator n=1 Tax=Paenibacillus sonchi TaxID=373687 RepID=UPI001E4FB7AD|nr:Rha family transcriptional regulator [Paenibacillus sonchi]MCE3203454.1 Rha family transcriptional regulator [Paenibacillus sonchi]